MSEFKVIEISIEGQLPEGCVDCDFKYYRGNDLANKVLYGCTPYEIGNTSSAPIYCPPTGRYKDCPLVQSTGFKVGDRVTFQKDGDKRNSDLEGIITFDPLYEVELAGCRGKGLYYPFQFKKVSP